MDFDCINLKESLNLHLVVNQETHYICRINKGINRHFSEERKPWQNTYTERKL